MSSKQKMRPFQGAEKAQKNRFFHPDYTVGNGISPCQPLEDQRVASCHRRWGISPRPETVTIIWHGVPRCQYCGAALPCLHK